MKNSVSGIYFIEWGERIFCFTSKAKAQEYRATVGYEYSVKWAKTPTEVTRLRLRYHANPDKFDFRDPTAERLVMQYR
jgi:hypothetical protein